MRNDTTPKGRLIMAIVALLAGLIIIFGIPNISIKVMDSILKSLDAKILQTNDPTLISAKTVFTFFFPFWTGLTVVGGALLLLLALPIYRGEKWARPIALVLLAVPAILGAYMFGPIMFFAKPLIAYAGIVAMLGLIPYFIILLCEKSSTSDKLINFLLFLFIGIETAYSFTNGHSSLRMFLGWAEGAARTTEYYLYAFGIPVIWFGVLMAIVGIPLYAGRRNSGWWLVTGGSFIMLLGTIIFYLAKPNGWFTTGIALTLISFILLLIPSIGGRPISETDKTGSVIQPLCEESN